MEPTDPYFKFDTIGEQVLSGLKVNDTLKFAGSNGFNQTYRIFKVTKTKQTVQDCNWTTGYCKIYYHYDELQIYFIRTDSTPLPPNSTLTYSMTLQMVLPAGTDKKNIPKDIKAKAQIWGNGFINYNKIPAPAPTHMSPYINYPDFYASLPTTTFTNAVRTYPDVYIIQSGNNAVYVDPLYGHQSTVNEVWFDKKYGFVFFKDVFGNAWSRTN